MKEKEKVRLTVLSKFQPDEVHQVKEHYFIWLFECFRPDFSRLFVLPCLTNDQFMGCSVPQFPVTLSYMACFEEVINQWC